MSSFLCEKGRNAKAMAIFQQQAACKVWASGDNVGRKRRGLPTCHKPPQRSHTTDKQQGLACVCTGRLLLVGCYFCPLALQSLTNTHPHHHHHHHHPQAASQILHQPTVSTHQQCK